MWNGDNMDHVNASQVLSPEQQCQQDRRIWHDFTSCVISVALCVYIIRIEITFKFKNHMLYKPCSAPCQILNQESENYIKSRETKRFPFLFVSQFATVSQVEASVQTALGSLLQWLGQRCSNDPAWAGHFYNMAFDSPQSNSRVTAHTPTVTVTQAFISRRFGVAGARRG